MRMDGALGRTETVCYLISSTEKDMSYSDIAADSA